MFILYRKIIAFNNWLVNQVYSLLILNNVFFLFLQNYYITIGIESTKSNRLQWFARKKWESRHKIYESGYWRVAAEAE